jgi:hypothetical protein
VHSIQRMHQSRCSIGLSSAKRFRSSRRIHTLTCKSSTTPSVC